MPAYPLTAERRRVVLALLSRSSGAPVRIISEEPVGHEWAPVTRVVVDRELPGVGTTVIVKTRRVEGDGHGGPAYLRREAAGLRSAEPSGVAPRLVHVDDSAGLVIQTDVGDWPTLQHLLLGDNPRMAHEGMTAMGTAVGRLHALSAGQRDHHRRALAEFGADVSTGVSYVHGAERWDALERACAELHLPAPRAARDVARELLQRTTHPGPYAALTHRDLNPTNVLVTDGGALLVDFEGCSFGHVGIDACFLQYPFPHHSTPWGVLPEAVVAAADSAYRAALADAGADQILAGYRPMLADGAAVVLIARLSRLPLLASQDQSPLDSWRRRGQIVQQIQTFTRLAERAGHLPALVDWLLTLVPALTDRWPDAAYPPAPPFAAFTSR